ncbi:efflux RND transporter periplasmic adaptor subunit, partial [candidate division WOR-3 bacterium]|nr:efflux RND transporter periplasmic adaptor subunit [candidate division WOR-3 bacterium]
AARAALAGATLGRMERLHAAGGISQQEMDRARAEAQAAGDALAAARTAVEAALAQRELALARFADCAITAPVAGTVAALVFRQGETVFPGAVVATIVDLSQTWLVGYLPERLLGRVRLGDTCRVRVDAYPQRTFDGVVSFIADRAEFTPRDIQTREERVNQVYRMKVTLANPERVFKPGMPADVRLLLR